MDRKPTYEDLEQKIETLERRVLFGEGEREEKYRFIVETLPQGVQEVDTSGKIVFANSAYHRMLGYENGELIGRFMYETQPDDHEQKALRDYVQMLVQQQPKPEPYFSKVVTKNGDINDVRTDWNYSRDEQGNISGFISIITDITEMKRAEVGLKQAHEELEMRVEKRTEQLGKANERLFQSEKKYRLIAENAADVIWVLDPESQTFTYVSPSVERMLGFTEKEAINRNLAQVVTPTSLEYIQRTTPIRIERMLQGDTSFFTDEIEVIHKDEHVVPTEINMRFVKNQFTGLVEATGVMRDITERKQAEEALKESEARFRNMFDNAAFGIIICRLIRDDTGAPIDFEHLKVNSATQRHTGFQTHQLLGKRASEIVSPEEAANLTGRYAQVVATRKPYGYERYFPVYDRTLDVGTFHLDDDLFVLTFIDISQRKKAEEALKGSEERFRLSFENANDGVCLVGIDGTFLNVNHRMCDIFGYGRNELEGMKVNDLTHPEDQNISPKFIEKGVSGEVENAVFEKRYFHKNGSIIFGQVSSSVIKDEKGEPLYFISHVQDISKRKQAEEERDRILTLSEDLICIAGMDGYFKYVNPVWEKLLGYSTGELLSQPFLDFIHPDDHGKNDAEIASLSEGKKTVGFENRYICRDGSILYVQWTAIPLLEEHQMYCIGRDITERKRSEEALRKSEKKYKTLIEAVPDMVWEFDENEIFTFCSQSYKEILGYEPEELVGKSAYSVMSEADSEKIRDEFGKIKSERRPFRDLLNRNLTKNGELRYLLSSGVPIIGEDGNYKGYRGIDKDITEYKSTEEALKESQERYRKILENVLVGVYQVTLDGKFLFANRKMIEMLGYSSEGLDAVDNIVELYARPEKRPEIVDEIIRKGFINREVEFRRKDGQTIWVKLHTRKTQNEKGAIILEGLMEDVTAIKNMETQLQQSQKMEAVGTLAGGIAHDFNNILAVILGNAELASDDIPDWNPASKSLGEIRLASIRAKEMVQQLLSFSRQTVQEKKPLNLVPIIEESMKMLRNAIPTSVEFKTGIPDDPCNILGDMGKINQIVMNLATNAAQAMSEKGGLLDVTLENIVLQEETTCFERLLSPGSYTMLKVRDTGGGINANIMDRIFEPYFTTKEVGKGTGMGLSVIHGLVKQHNGGIRVESELGKGTLFEVYFPVIMEKAGEEKAPMGKIEGGNEKILFVDDEPSIVDLNRQRLERLGYQVKSTTKPLEALEWFKSDPDQFDVIITDMTMPRMTGDRLTKEILKIRPHMPVIICTGYSERMSEKKAEVLGVRKYIEKPIDARNLASALREVLEEPGLTIFK